MRVDELDQAGLLPFVTNEGSPSEEVDTLYIEGPTGSLRVNMNRSEPTIHKSATNMRGRSDIDLRPHHSLSASMLESS